MYSSGEVKSCFVVNSNQGIFLNILGHALFNQYMSPVISKPSIETLRLMFQDNNGGVSGYESD